MNLLCFLSILPFSFIFGSLLFLLRRFVPLSGLFQPKFIKLIGIMEISFTPFIRMGITVWIFTAYHTMEIHIHLVRIRIDRVPRDYCFICRTITCNTNPFVVSHDAFVAPISFGIQFDVCVKGVFFTLAISSLRFFARFYQVIVQTAIEWARRRSHRIFCTVFFLLRFIESTVADRAE